MFVFVCLQDDAQIVHDLLEWKLIITGVGHCRQVGCPEKGLGAAIQALTDAGHKVSPLHERKHLSGTQSVLRHTL